MCPEHARARIFSLLTESYVHVDGPRGALEAVRRGLEQLPRAPELLLLEGSILGALGELGAAEATLTFALELPPTPDLFGLVDATLPLRTRHMLARLHLLRGHAERAEYQARTILRDRPGFGPAVLTLGEALLCRGDEAAFEQLVGGIPDDPEAPTGRAVLWAMKALADGDPERALAIVTEGLERDPQSAFLQRVRVRALLAAGRTEAHGALQDRRRDDPLDLTAMTIGTGEPLPRWLGPNPA
jgi:tetratricopeptide (TPR) repeat protein